MRSVPAIIQMLHGPHRCMTNTVFYVMDEADLESTDVPHSTEVRVNMSIWEKYSTKKAMAI